MAKKEFYGEVSIVARLGFRIEAENKEEAIKKLLEASCPIILEDSEGNEIEITEQEWDMIEEVRDGNVRENHIRDLEIFEEK